MDQTELMLDEDEQKEAFSLKRHLATKERKHFLSTGKSGATMSQINDLTVFLYSIENDCFCFFICICVCLFVFLLLFIHRI